MSRHIVHASDDVVVERMRPEHVAAADELWLRNVDKAIEGEKNTISALQVHVSEIDETLTALGKLHEKVHYDAMVPYGKVAMFKGQMIRTNEVFVHLSSTVLVHTSTKQAQSILQRRRDYTVDKQDLVRQQLDALKSRRVFADSEKEQDGEKVEEIVEVYDEQVHGPLDAPMVRDEVYAGRKYFGPPRNETERIAHETEMEALRSFVAEHAGDHTAAADAQQGTHGSLNPEAGSSHSADSDDEDSSTLAQPAADMMSTSAAAAAAGPQLEQEIDRLVAAFEDVDVMHGASQGNTTAQTVQPGQPLIQEIQYAPEEIVPDRDVPGRGEGARMTAAAQPRKQFTAQQMGIKHGFFNSAAKPKKGILKKVDPPAEAAQVGQSSGLQVSRALAKKDGPTAAELSAFSGVVKERSGVAVPNISSDPQQASATTTAPKSTKRVSKFRSQRTATTANPSS